MADWTDATLLVVAHGSSTYPAAADDLRRIIAQIEERKIFSQILLAFWRQDPFLSPDHLLGSRIFVLPYLAGRGKHSDELIPSQLELTGAVTVRGGQTILYCAPVGCHPDLPDLVRTRALAVCRSQAFDPADTALLLIAHGSKQGDGAKHTPEAVAQKINALGGLSETKVTYLEQAPFAADWQDQVRARHIIAQPLLLSAGMHASADLPPLFEMQHASDSPSQVAGRLVWLQQGIATDEEIVTMMLDQVAQAESALLR
jgi:sirohydrochlorin cobaltochelatase